APPLLEGDGLGPGALLDALGGDRGAGDHRGAQRGRVAADDEDLAELDDLARLALDLLDLEQVIGGDAVLLTAGLDDCEHRSRPRVRYPVLGGFRTGFFQSLWGLAAPNDARGMLMAAGAPPLHVRPVLAWGRPGPPG